MTYQGRLMFDAGTTIKDKDGTSSNEYEEKDDNNYKASTNKQTQQVDAINDRLPAYNWIATKCPFYYLWNTCPTSRLITQKSYGTSGFGLIKIREVWLQKVPTNHCTLLAGRPSTRTVKTITVLGRNTELTAN